MTGRILLADDSPNAQRMGERILAEEGFEIVTAVNADEALTRLAETRPDVILADAYLPGKSGFDLCREIKADESRKHMRVILTAGMLEPFDETEAQAAGCDGILKKPFEASAVVEMIKPMVEASRFSQGLFGEPPAAPEEKIVRVIDPALAEPDPERVRAAITLALDAALPTMIKEITERVLVALGH